MPVIMGLGLLFAFRSDYISYGWNQMLSLAAAASWGFFGPAAIWYYERYTLPLLNKHCRTQISDKHHRRLIQRAIYTRVADIPATKWITYAWIIAVVYAFTNSMEAVRDYGLFGFQDPLWWFVFGGVSLFAFYTSFGFCFAFRSLHLIHLIAKAPVRHNLYHCDGVLGFAFIGHYALATNFLFASGWLWVPLLVYAGSDTRFWPFNDRQMLVAGYALYLSGVFIIPIVLIHRKIIQVKNEILDVFGTAASTRLDKLVSQHDERLASEFEFSRTVVDDARKVSNWPLSMEVVVPFTLSTLWLPFFVGVIIGWLA
ncbi:MAG: hypothetical protein AB7I36_20960 [Rhodospirillaceae bacterium]